MTWRLGVIGITGAMALLLTAFVDVARSQIMPQAPPLSPEQKKWLEDQNRYLQKLAQSSKEQEKAGVTPYPGGSVYWVKKEVPPPTWQEQVIFHPVTWVIAGGSVLLGIVVQLYFRLSSTTDPAKLAQTDPWFQAQLAQQKSDSTPGVPAEPKGPSTE
jgi:hypothetical protein